MSKARVVVLEVVSGHLTVTAAARAYGLSRQHIYRLLQRYHLGGLDAVEPRSRRPASNPRAVPDDVIAAVVLLREKLTTEGLDAGPDQPVRPAWAAPDCLRAQQLRLSQRAHAVQRHGPVLQRHRGPELRRASPRPGLPRVVHRARQHLR